MSELFNLEDHAAAEYTAAGFVVFPSCLLTAAAEPVEFIARNEARTVEFKALLMQVIA